jgi:hypothetical protein
MVVMAALLKNESGNVLVLFGLSLPILLGVSGAALDYSELVRLRTSMQSAADDAALASAKVLAASNASTASGKENEARAAAERVLRDRTFDTNYTIDPSSGSRSVEVSLTAARKGVFAGLRGGAESNLSVRARATYEPPPPTACIIALGTDEDAGIHLVGSAKIDAPRCGVWSNAAGPDSITTQGAAKITAGNVCGVGGVGSAHSSPPAKSQCSVAEDPFKSRPRRCGDNLSSSNCTVYKTSNTSGGAGKGKGDSGSTFVSTYTGKCDFSGFGVPANAKGTVALTPGVYCGGLSIQSADVQLAPGFYQMQDGPLSLQGNASVKGTGVSILLSGSNAVLDLQGSPNLTLSAMTTGSLAGIAISSDTPAAPPLVSTMQGSPDISLTGSLRLPGQVLKMQGSPKLTLNGATDKAVAYAFDLHGSPDLISKADDSGGRKAGAVAKLRLVK